MAISRNDFHTKGCDDRARANCLQKVIGALLMCADDNEDCSCVWMIRKLRVQGIEERGLVKVIRWWLFCRRWCWQHERKVCPGWCAHTRSCKQHKWIQYARTLRAAHHKTSHRVHCACTYLCVCVSFVFATFEGSVHVCEYVRATGVPTTPQCEHWKQLIELDWSSVPIFVFALLLAFCACNVVCTLCGTLQIMGRPEKTAIRGLCRGQTVSSSSPPESFLPKTFQPFPAINCLRPRFKAPAIIAPRLIQCSS